MRPATRYFCFGTYLFADAERRTVKNREVTLDELARILGKSRHYVLDRLRRGLPYTKKGGRGRAYKFNSGEAIRWIARHDASGHPPDSAAAEVRRRHWVAMAETKEFELAQKRCSLIRVEDARAIVAEEYAIVRSRILAIPHNVSPKVVGMTDPAAVEAVLRGEIVAALTELTADDRERAPFRAGAN
jgi:terminase small subunit / prophage DNA-packing protein